jgi:hypothetical protein
MGKPLTDLSFEEWVLFVFDHPVDESRLEWYWNLDADRWVGQSGMTIEYLTRFFNNAEDTLLPYSDTQLNQGLWYLASNACSEHMLALLDTDVPWPARQRCIQSLVELYRQCFVKRCTSHLSHLDEPGAGPLNLVCYMWWDLLPMVGQPGNPNHREMDQTVLETLRSILQLGSLPCQESALHGLGHWHRSYPRQVEESIHNFLKKNEGIPERLRRYAINAFQGCVL